MIKVTQDQGFQRWDLLPLNLREALYSEANSDFLWKTCEAEHIPDKNIYDVARISGYVLMGFLHPEDVAEELHEAIGIDLKTASSIEDELNKRIFIPLRDEINAAYKPLSKFEVGGPKIMQEVKPPTKPTAPVAPAPKIISQTFDAASLTIGATPLSFNKDRPAPAPQPAKPTTPSTQGWSKQSPQQPVVKLGQVGPTIPAPAKIAPMPTAAPAAPKLAAPRVGNAMSEFDRLDLMKKAPTAIPSMPASQSTNVAPAKPAPLPPKPSEPAPVMLHQISGTTAISQSPNLGMAAGTKNQIGANLPPIASPTKPAVLEFSGKAPTSSSTAKVVHYSEYKTPAPAPIPASDGPRQVTQIVAPAPMQTPAQPPSPQTVTTPPPASPKPQPPTPTIAGAQKVIVKDFLQ